MEKNLRLCVLGCLVITLLLGAVLIFLLAGKNISFVTTSPRITVSGSTVTVDAGNNSSFSFTIQGQAYVTGRIYAFLPFTAGSQYSNPALVYVEDADYRQILADYKKSKTLPTRPFGRSTKTISLLTDKPRQIEILEKLSKNKKGSLFTITGKFLGIKEMSAMGMNMPLSNMQAMMDGQPDDLAAKIVWVDTLNITEATPDLIWQNDYPSLDPMFDKFLQMKK